MKTSALLYSRQQLNLIDISSFFMQAMHYGTCNAQNADLL